MKRKSPETGILFCEEDNRTIITSPYIEIIGTFLLNPRTVESLRDLYAFGLTCKSHWSELQATLLSTNGLQDFISCLAVAVNVDHVYNDLHAQQQSINAIHEVLNMLYYMEACFNIIARVEPMWIDCWFQYMIQLISSSFSVYFIHFKRLVSVMPHLVFLFEKRDVLDSACKLAITVLLYQMSIDLEHFKKLDDLLALQCDACRVVLAKRV